MSLRSLDALSPIDGRYARSAEPLRPLLSEAALIRERLKIEAEWLLHLAASKPPGLPAASRVSSVVLAAARKIAAAPAETSAESVKAIEQRTNQIGRAHV